MPEQEDKKSLKELETELNTLITSAQKLVDSDAENTLSKRAAQTKLRQYQIARARLRLEILESRSRLAYERAEATLKKYETKKKADK